MNFEGWENKAGQIETYITVPYSEIEINIVENSNDPNFFNKHTVRVKININKDNQNYLFNQKIKCTFSENVKYILLDNPYVYPHNWYYFYNRQYLINKVIFSLEYITNFINAYKAVFNNNIPFLYINKIDESSSEYNFELVIKEYLDIFYVSTDKDNTIIYMNLLVDNSFQKGKSVKYKKIKVSIPRIIKDKQNKFKFITGNWTKK